MGISNTVANISGVLAPYFVGAVTNGNVRIKPKQNVFLADLSFQQTIAAWRIVFLTAAAINVVVNMFYVVFATANIQPWNTYWLNKKKDSE